MRSFRDARQAAGIETTAYDPLLPAGVLADERADRPERIAFFGNFGMQNLGNESTLAAMIKNARQRLPDAELTCICPDPQDTSARHGIAASLLSYRFSREFAARPASSNPVVGFVRRLCVRLPSEVLELFRAFRALRGVTMLVMTGTGMLSDFGIRPLGLHYEILKWSLLAKLRGARLMFVSVGAGPIALPLSRFLVKLALSLADYRSYRDDFSRSYLKEVGFDTGGEEVYPHIAFSLPMRARSPAGGDGRVVAVGLMDYYGSRASSRVGEEAYLDYVSKVAKFVSWLVEHDYRVRLLIGDVTYDRRSVADVLQMLRAWGTPSRDGQIVAAPVASAERLVEELAGTDLVVATRFHNVLLGLMLGKPVVALSYHPKLAALMEAMGLSQYCHEVDHLDVERLIEQFTDAERNRARLAAAVERRSAECRRALDRQYQAIFDPR